MHMIRIDPKWLGDSEYLNCCKYNSGRNLMTFLSNCNYIYPRGFTQRLLLLWTKLIPFRCLFHKGTSSNLSLTHWGRDKMATDDIFKRISLNENFQILNKISLKYVPLGLIDNMAALVWIMAWRRTGDKPLSEPMMTQFTDAYMSHSASMT